MLFRSVSAAARTWLTDGAYSLTILPFDYKPQGEDVDRKAMPLPAPGAITAGRFPQVQRATLSNGLKVMLVERHQAPLVSIHVLLDTAYAADFAQTKAGTGALALRLLDEGTTTRDALALARRWTPPELPVSGGDALKLGLKPGPKVGALIAEVERWWIAGDFAADRAACLAELERIAKAP